jgi:hypothetical protein
VQPFLVAVVVVDHRQRRVGVAADVADGDRVEATFREEHQGRLADALFDLAAFLAVRRGYVAVLGRFLRSMTHARPAPE